MPLLTHAKNLLQRIARRKPKLPRRAAAETPRLRGFEIMEPRQLLAADPLYVGAVYIEEDIGSDAHGDTFELTFEGGAEGTQLTRVAIRTDQNLPGLSGGDLIFDTVEGGLGADHAFPFTLVAFQTADPQATVRATVEDGGLLLVLDLTGFHAGDKLVFTIDVDEVQGFDPAEVDYAAINESIDPLASGVEFQGSRLTATFAAPHFHEAEAAGEFRNRYDAALAGTGLNLPADDAGGKRDRSTGAVGQTQQQPLPISVSGKVFLETDLDLQQDAGEPGLAGVALALWQLDDGTYRFTGHTTATDAQGRYLFGLGLNLQPGVYQVRETQPAGLFSVGAVPGTVAGAPAGRTVTGDRDLLTDIAVPLGGTHAVDFDFAEAAPAELSGYVYHDRDNDGRRDAGEEGLSGVQVVDFGPRYDQPSKSGHRHDRQLRSLRRARLGAGRLSRGGSGAAGGLPGRPGCGGHGRRPGSRKGPKPGRCTGRNLPGRRTSRGGLQLWRTGPRVDPRPRVRGRPVR